MIARTAYYSIWSMPSPEEESCNREQTKKN